LKADKVAEEVLKANLSKESLLQEGLVHVNLQLCRLISWQH